MNRTEIEEKVKAFLMMSLRLMKKRLLLKQN